LSEEDLVRGLARRMERRKFLAKLGAGSLGVVLGLAGQSKQAAALWTVWCCHLCLSPNQGCVGGCSTCAWCWSCLHTDGFWYQCCECHYIDDGCPDASCTRVYCSEAWKLGQGPSGSKGAPERVVAA
jgi:hypothetical protein